MGIRDSLNQNPGITTGVTAAMIVLALAWIAWSTFGSAWTGVDGPRLYYSSDDGKTFVPGPLARRYSATGIIAHVFTCDEDKSRFVGYLERYTPEAIAAMKDRDRRLAKRGGGPEMTTLDPAIAEGRLVKKPGVGAWVNASSPAGAAVMNVVCPGGGDARPDEVLPADE